MTSVLHDLRYAFRQLRRSPGFAAGIVTTLGLAIGLATALFSVADAVLLKPLPYGEPDRAVTVWSSWSDFPRTWVSYDEIEAYAAEIDAFSEVGMFLEAQGNVTGGERPERIRFAGLTENVFRILGVEPILGRGFLPEEDVPDAAPVVVLGHGLWQRRFAGDPAVLGQSLELDGTSYTIVGVMPAGFKLPLDFGAERPTEAWVALGADPEDFGAVPGPGMAENGGSHTFYGLARLAPGATAETANRELRALTDRWTADGIYQEGWGFRAFAVPVPEDITGEVRPALLLLLAAVGLLVLVGAANVAGLLLIRGEERRRELGVRAALGAGRRRLVRHLLVESGILSLGGGVLGACLAAVGVALVRSGAPPSLPRVAEVEVGGGVLLAALGLTSVVTILLGLVPALRTGRVDPAEALGGATRSGTAGRREVRLRRVLVAAQVGVAVVLAVGSGLMIRTVSELLSIDPGFRTSEALTFEVSVPSDRYPEATDVVAFHRELRQRLEGLPGVRSAGAARVLPLASEIGNTGLDVEGYEPPPGEGSPGDWQVVTPGYMEAVGLRLLDGRFLEASDGAEAAPVLVINRAMAERYFAGRDPVGGRVRIGFARDGPWFTVVGVVENVRHNGLTEEVRPKYYAVHDQFAAATGFAPRSMSFVVHGETNPTALAGPAAAELGSLDPEIPLAGARPIADVVGDVVARSRFTMLLLSVFAVVALALVGLGVYAVVAHTVVSRRRELGIRLAVGATPGRIIRLAMEGGMWPVLVGTLAGLTGGAVLGLAIAALLHGISPLDPLTFVAVSATVFLVAAAAAAVPALRAGRIDPAASLTAE